MNDIALLLLAHKNAEYVNRLMDQVNKGGIDIYLHCDRRWEDGYRIFVNSKQCKCCGNRYKVNLDEWSLVQAEIELLKTATKFGRYKYYILLSGQDYPIVPIDEICENLRHEYPKPFIDCTPIDKKNWVYGKFCSNDTFFRYSRYVNSKISTGILRKLVKVIPYVVCGITSVLSNPKRRLGKLNVDLYGGSAWWILPDLAVNFILDEINQKPQYIDELSHTITPEETFFQIMTMRSPVRNLVELNRVDEILQNCKTYAYFFSDKKKFIGHPYVFENTDEDRLLLEKKRKEFWFARKFDPDIDTEILDYIDEQMLKNNSPRSEKEYIK